MNRANLITTRTGLTIGCAYQAPPPRMGRDAEHVQAALLSNHTERFEKVLDWIDRAAPYAYGLLVAVGFVFWIVAKVLR